MKKPVISFFCLLIGSIISCQVTYAQFDQANNPQTIEEIKKIRAEIPDWKTLKNTVYAGIPYPDRIEHKYWKAQLDEYIKKEMNYSMKWSSISMFREINAIKDLSAEANALTQFLGGNNELNKLMSRAGEQMGSGNPINQLMGESKKSISTSAKALKDNADSDFAKELGLKYDQPKDSSSELKTESQRLEQQVTRAKWTCDSLFAEAIEGTIPKLLGDELQYEIQKNASTVSLYSTDKEREQFEANVRKISSEWYRRNYINENGRGLMAAEKANQFLIDKYLPLAEKRIFVDSRVHGFEPTLLLQKLYLDAIIKLYGSRLAMLREMATCFTN